jgi:hypothetical protein
MSTVVKKILQTPSRFIDNYSVDSLREYEKTTDDQEPVAGRAGTVGTATKQAKFWSTGKPFTILFTRQKSYKTVRAGQAQPDDEYATDGQNVDGAVGGDGIANLLIKSGETIVYGDMLEIETATGLFVKRTTGPIHAYAMEDSGGALSANTLLKGRPLFLHNHVP